VYVLSPTVFDRMPEPGVEYSMNDLLPAMAHEDQLQSMLLTGYWVRGRLPLALSSLPLPSPSHPPGHRRLPARTCTQGTNRSPCC
jgi:hypothetical protein